VSRRCGLPRRQWTGLFRLPSTSPKRRLSISEELSLAEALHKRNGSCDSKPFAHENPDLAAEFQRVIDRRLPNGWDTDLPVFTPADGPMATRVASGKVIEILGSRLPEMMGGSADLGPSTHTNIDGVGNFEPEDWAGRNMHFGIRENAMGAILNGMALHSGLIPYGGTFFVFSDYMRPPMRLAAMNALPVIYIFTHDSIGMGEDGPTHQPVEQLIGLRSIPGMVVLRPADANETLAAWRVAIGRKQGPVALVLTRQSLPVLDLNSYPAIPTGVPLGGYILADSPISGRPDIVLIATGSEVQLALDGRERLAAGGVHARVVSMPSTSLFAAQSDDYRERILPTGVPILVIEAGSPVGWQSFVGPRIAVIGIDTFGSSAPGPVVMEHYGFTAENVCRQAHRVLDNKKEGAPCASESPQTMEGSF
jgi:transketolase